MTRTIVLILVLLLAGILVGYLLFAKVGGSYLSPEKLLSSSKNILQGIENSILGVEKIRRKILICAAAGAVAGLLLGLFTSPPRKRRRR